MSRLLRLLWTAVLVVLAIRILDRYLTPLLPLLLTLLMFAVIVRVAFGQRSL